MSNRPTAPVQLIGAFRFAALQAVILNKAMSLVVVASALPFRAAAVPFASVAAHWPIIDADHQTGNNRSAPSTPLS